MESVRLEFDDDALDFIVDKAVEYKLGARGLRSICEAIMTDVMFHLPSQKDVKHFTVTLELSEEKITKSKLRHSRWRNSFITCILLHYFALKKIRYA